MTRLHRIYGIWLLSMLAIPLHSAVASEPEAISELDATGSVAVAQENATTDASSPTELLNAASTALASSPETSAPEDLPTATSSPDRIVSSNDVGFPATALPSWETWTSPERLTGSLRVVAMMAALSLAPAMLLMTTCYVRLVVVLNLLRQALGSQQLPPQQVITTLAVFLTALIMWPVWNQVHQDAIQPYTDPAIPMTASEAWNQGIRPIRNFMLEQIRRADNGPDVALFLDYLQVEEVHTNDDIPLQAILPAFLISELKVAFLIGFQIYLPFVLLDLVVSSVTMSMGMLMVPPTTISLPLKLIMFVLVDGWHLVVEMLLMSFASG